MTNLKRRCKGAPEGRFNRRSIDLDVDHDYLLGLWDDQGGLCNLSGLPMDMSYDLSARKCTGPNRLFYPSLDRIDSDLGYVPGNVQWVCMGINYLKNSCTDEQALEFLTALL